MTLRDVDELDTCLVKLFLVFLVHRPIGIGFFDDDLAFFNETRDDERDLELLELRFFRTESDVLEIHEQS